MREYDASQIYFKLSYMEWAVLLIKRSFSGIFMGIAIAVIMALALAAAIIGWIFCGLVGIYCKIKKARNNDG